jgi:RNA polymerase sigma factor (TIGR02999 family)
VYDELRRMARRYMRDERAANTLQTTALVNEVYLRLVDVKNVDWQQRAQFFAITTQMMRRILVDAARARGSHKRGAGAVKVNVDDVPVMSPQPDASWWPWMKPWRPSRRWLPARPSLSSCAILAG